MQPFKIRCSQIGKIMGQKGLGLTGLGYVEQWIKENLYSRRKEFTSKFTEKGNEVEQISLDFLADYLDYGFLDKNTKFFENDYLTGTPDVITKDHLIDVKNSWDCFTFPLFDEKINPDYYLQGQGYMELTGLKKYKLIYTLTNTPEELILKEATNFCYKNNLELDDEILNSFINKMTYDSIPNNLKIKVYEFEKDDIVINQIYERVRQCRVEVEKLLNTMKSHELRILV